MATAFALLATKKKISQYIPPLRPLHLTNEMREQVRAFQECVVFNRDEVRVTVAPGGLMALILPSSLSLLSYILLLLTWDMSLLFTPFRPRARGFACSRKRFDYLSSSASSGKIIMGFHELLQMNCDFELMICNS